MNFSVHFRIYCKTSKYSKIGQIIFFNPQIMANLYFQGEVTVFILVLVCSLVFIKVAFDFSDRNMVGLFFESFRDK